MEPGLVYLGNNFHEASQLILDQAHQTKQNKTKMATISSLVFPLDLIDCKYVLNKDDI